uniref:Uncharacterized protein n=1 Tax=Nelumbo nucifera TaxID=4432 RepID=A0A822YU34_NELNU|nr:TPA_asm: hypothetical protein HUJ06_006688 [Nelumbo nucifera]
MIEGFHQLCFLIVIEKTCTFGYRGISLTLLPDCHEKLSPLLPPALDHCWSEAILTFKELGNHFKLLEIRSVSNIIEDLCAGSPIVGIP